MFTWICQNICLNIGNRWRDYWELGDCSVALTSHGPGDVQIHEGRARGSRRDVSRGDQLTPCGGQAQSRRSGLRRVPSDMSHFKNNLTWQLYHKFWINCLYAPSFSNDLSHFTHLTDGLMSEYNFWCGCILCFHDSCDFTFSENYILIYFLYWGGDEAIIISISVIRCSLVLYFALQANSILVWCPH